MACLRMRSSLVVKEWYPAGTPVAVTNVDGPEFKTSILRYSGIRGAANEAVLNKVAIF